MNPQRAHFAPRAPTKADHRAEVQMVVLQRSAAGLDFPERLIASMARSHDMTVADVEKMIANEVARREALA